MLHVVTGAPCAGKTTYIAQHKKDGDIVIDLDAIAVSLGAKSSHEYGENIMRVALAARKAAIGEIGESDAWVIHTQPTKAQRDGYKDAVFHDLDPGVEECIRRAKNDGRPNGTLDAIRYWYRESESRDSFSIGQSETERRNLDGSETGPFFMPETGRKAEVMAEESNVQGVAEGTEGTDWKAKYEEMRGHMRDWEKKAKANQTAADELEKLRAAQMTEQEKERERADNAERELAELKAEKARTEAALRITKDTGVPLDLLMFCSDEEAMTDFAAKYTADSRIPSAPSATGVSRIVRSGNDENAEVGAFVHNLFKKD